MSASPTSSSTIPTRTRTQDRQRRYGLINGTYKQQRHDPVGAAHVHVLMPASRGGVARRIAMHRTARPGVTRPRGLLRHRAVAPHRSHVCRCPPRAMVLPRCLPRCRPSVAGASRAVLGAGVMGAQIAAHLANAGVPVVLFDLAAQAAIRTRSRGKAIDGAGEARAGAARRKDRAAQIDAANYDGDLRATRRLRPRDRGDRRAHRLEARPVREDRAAPRAVTRSSRRTPRGCRSTRSPRRCPPRCGRASAASISSIRRATCIWSS